MNIYESIGMGWVILGAVCFTAEAVYFVIQGARQHLQQAKTGREVMEEVKTK